MIIKKFTVCKFSKICKYNQKNSCFGTVPSRDVDFHCDYMSENGEYTGIGESRSLLDKTGKMEFIQE